MILNKNLNSRDLTRSERMTHNLSFDQYESSNFHHYHITDISGYTMTISWTICIEYVAHQCENSFDSWTPSGVLYF